MRRPSTTTTRTSEASAPPTPSEPSKTPGTPGSAPRPKRYARWRAYTLIGVNVLIAAHIAQWLITGTTIAPLELNEVLHTLHAGIITLGFLFMATAAIATAVLGRFFCSWGCHLLALQDLCAWLLGKLRIKPRPIRSRVLRLVPIGAVLYLFVWPQIERLLDHRPFPRLRVLSDADGWASFVTQDLWRNLPGPVIAALTFAICGFGIVYVLGSRAFCLYGCPYGVLFGLADRLAPMRIVAKGQCHQCGICTAVCQSRVRVHEEIEAHGQVVSCDCLKDLDCVAACPNGVLQYGRGRNTLLMPRVRGKDPRYDYTLGEDLLLGASWLVLMLVFRGLYGVVPFLMAVGAAGVGAHLVVSAVRLALRPRVRVGHVELKSGGSLTSRGLLFATGAGLAGLLVAHSAVVRWHEHFGQRAFDRVQAQLRAGDRDGARASADEATAHLEVCERWGLYAPVALQRRLASLAQARGDDRATERHLRSVVADEPSDGQARWRLGMLLGRRERLAEGAVHLREAARLLPNSAPVRNDLGVVLARLERDSEAIAVYRQALRLSPRYAEAHANLGILYASRGDWGAATAELSRALALEPRHAQARSVLAMAERMRRR